VAKAIWHKATSPPQMDGTVVFSRWRHIGTTWQIWLYLCFLRPTRVHNPNGKSIGSDILHSSWQCHWVCPGTSFPLTIAPSHQESGPHLIHASLGPPESITQTAFQSFIHFCHSVSCCVKDGSCSSSSLKWKSMDSINGISYYLNKC